MDQIQMDQGLATSGQNIAVPVASVQQQALAPVVLQTEAASIEQQALPKDTEEALQTQNGSVQQQALPQEMLPEQVAMMPSQVHPSFKAGLAVQPSQLDDSSLDQSPEEKRLDADASYTQEGFEDESPTGHTPLSLHDSLRSTAQQLQKTSIAENESFSDFEESGLSPLAASHGARATVQSPLAGAAELDNALFAAVGITGKSMPSIGLAKGGNSNAAAVGAGAGGAVAEASDACGRRLVSGEEEKGEYSEFEETFEAFEKSTG